MKRVTPLRAFIVIMHPSLDLVVFALVVIGCAALDAAHRPSLFDECYALALVFQMFSASTGFGERAARGHFDTVLTGHPRRAVAAAHLAISTVPGVLVWVGVGAIDGLARHRLPVGFNAQALAAFACVSLLAWAVGLALPRYGAGIAWLTLIIVLAGSGYASVTARMVTADGPWLRQLERTAGYLAVPMLLIAGPAPPPALITMLVALAGAVIASCGILFIDRFDGELKDLS
jgi:hypothetical protein